MSKNTKEGFEWTEARRSHWHFIMLRGSVAMALKSMRPMVDHPRLTETANAKLKIIVAYLEGLQIELKQEVCPK